MNSDNVGVVLVDIFRNINTNSLYMTEHGRMYSDSIELIKDAIKLSSMIYDLQPGVGFGVEKKTMVDLASQLTCKYKDLKIELEKGK